MESANAGSGRFVGAFRNLGASLLATVHDRVELVAIELQEEKLRLVQILIWIGTLFFLGLMTMAFACMTVLYIFWTTARLAVMVGLAVFFAGALVTVAIAFRRYLARQPKPFAASLREIGEDRACIQTEN